jgi:hypothetical protein
MSCAARATAGEFLLRDHLVQAVGRHAAEPSREADAEQAHFAGMQEHLARHAAGLVPGLGMRRHLAQREARSAAGWPGRPRGLR